MRSRSPAWRVSTSSPSERTRASQSSARVSGSRQESKERSAMHTVLESRSKTVTIGHDQPFCVIGERINPTGRKAFSEELRSGDLSRVREDAIAHAEAGAEPVHADPRLPPL